MAKKTSHTDPVRIDQRVRPTHYDIFLTPDLEKSTFSGRVVIDVVVPQHTITFELHADKLQVLKATVLQEGSSQIPLAARQDKKKKRVLFSAPQDLKKGDACIFIDYTGILHDDMAGFYRSTYEAGGEKRVMAVTQFEDTDARRAFPCVDEPAAKARFQVTMRVPKTMRAISNMPVLDEIAVDGGKKIVRFEETPVMSTYLLAFLVGEFEQIEGRTKNNTLVRVITTPGKKEQGRFALEVGTKTLEYFEEYFGTPYPLPKLDLIAIPDFAAGAMENWGAVTFREVSILFHPQRSSEAAKQRVALVVAHELAHQWFGNLVTMDWWTGLWLNEGFASWIEYLALDHLFPEWKVWEQFVAMDYASARDADALRTTHAVEPTALNPEELRQQFDAISYSKGASVIRMIHDYVGADAFRDGLRLYLRRHQYGNAVTDDLWRALEEKSGKSVKLIMDTWIKQPGYPVVYVEKTDAQNTYECRQSRFLSSGEAFLQEEEKQVWDISLPVLIGSGEEIRREPFAITGSTASFLKPKGVQWLKLNAGQVSMARVAYPQGLWENLFKAMQAGALHPIDFAGIVDDTAALAQAGMTSSTILLSTLLWSRSRESYVVWSAVAEGMGALTEIIPFGRVATRARFDTFARHVFASIVSKRGWEEGDGESQMDILTRSIALHSYGYYGDGATLREAAERFYKFVEDPNSLNPNLYREVFNLTPRGRNDQETYDALVTCYREARTPEESVRFLIALAKFRDLSLLEKALRFSMSPEVRSQDTFRVIIAVAANEYGSESAWRFVREEWGELCKRYRGNIMMLSRMLEGVLGVFSTEARALEVEHFFKEHKVPEASRAIAKSLERIRARAAWIDRDYNAIEAWLREWERLKSI